MLHAFLVKFLDRLAVRAERLSWWAYDRSARLRRETAYRHAAHVFKHDQPLSTYMAKPPVLPALRLQPALELAPAAQIEAFVAEAAADPAPSAALTAA